MEKGELKWLVPTAYMQELVWQPLARARWTRLANVRKQKSSEKWEARFCQRAFVREEHGEVPEVFLGVFPLEDAKKECEKYVTVHTAYVPIKKL